MTNTRTSDGRHGGSDLGVAAGGGARQVAEGRRLPYVPEIGPGGRRRRCWERMCRGKTLGIVGMGRIGQAVAQRANPVSNMRIRYTSAPRAPERLPSQWESRGPPRFAEGSRFRESACAAERRHPSPDRRSPAGTDETDSVSHQHTRDRSSKRQRWSMRCCKASPGGAGLDVFEQEPLFHPSLRELRQVVLPPPGFQPRWRRGSGWA